MNVLRKVLWVAAVLPLTSALGCGKHAVGETCSTIDDCQPNLVCALQLCRQTCHNDQDCRVDGSFGLCKSVALDGGSQATTLYCG